MNERLRIRGISSTMNCKHEKWLYATNKDRADAFGMLLLDVNNFLCVECGEWIGIESVFPVEKIINIKHLPKETCPHDIFYTMDSNNICLRCGYEWMPEIKKLDIDVDPYWENYDKERRRKILEDFKNGKIY